MKDNYSRNLPKSYINSIKLITDELKNQKYVHIIPMPRDYINLIKLVSKESEMKNLEKN